MPKPNQTGLRVPDEKIWESLDFTPFPLEDLAIRKKLGLDPVQAFPQGDGVLSRRFEGDKLFEIRENAGIHRNHPFPRFQPAQES